MRFKFNPLYTYPLTLNYEHLADFSQNVQNVQNVNS